MGRILLNETSESTSSKWSIKWLVIFLLWPFLSFLRAIGQYWQPWAKNLVWLFTIFFGYNIVSQGSYTDIQGYISQFKEFTRSDSTFVSFLNTLYSKESGYTDIIQQIVTYLTSRFTTDPRILTALFGAIFGFFYSRNIWYLIEIFGKPLTLISGFLLIIFSLIMGMWEMNVYRFGTATHVFLFGALPYLFERKKKYLIVSAVSILFHFSFILPVAFMLIYIFLGNRSTLFYLFYVISFFIAALDLETLRQYLWFLPEVFQTKVTIYTNEGFANRRAEGFIESSWHLRFAATSIKYSVLVLSSWFFINWKSFKKADKYLLSIYSVSLFFLAVFNVLGVIPGIDKFPRLGYLLFFAFLFSYVQSTEIVKSLKGTLILVSPLLLFYCLFNIRMWLGFVSFSTLLSNPFFAWVFENETSIIDEIKSLLTF